MSKLLWNHIDYSDDIAIPRIEAFDPVTFPDNVLEPNNSSIYFGPRDEQTVFETTLQDIKDVINEDAHAFWGMILWPPMEAKAPFMYKNPGVFYYGDTVVEYSRCHLYIAEYSEFNSFYSPAELRRYS